MRQIFLLLMLCCCSMAMAQNGGIIGKALDDKKQPAIGAVIQVTEAGVAKSATQVFEDDGSYLVKPLPAGRYTLKVTFVGYRPCIVTGVLVSPDKNTEVNIVLVADSGVSLRGAIITGYKIPLVDKYQPGAATSTLSCDQTDTMPVRNAYNKVSLESGTPPKPRRKKM